MSRELHTGVVPRPAATVVLLRPGPDGAEILLTRRPSTMAFAADLHVFPGGAVDAADREAAGTDDPWAVARHAAVREAREEAGVELDPAALVALSQWTTPPILPRRYSTRFFVADLPVGTELVFAADEVVDHIWLTPTAALDAMGDQAIELWIPTSSTLVQLEGVRSVDDVRTRLATDPIESVTVERSTVTPLGRDVARVEANAAGGIPGRRAVGHLVGRRRLVLVDHGDPSDDAANAVLDEIARRMGSLEAVVLSSPHPDQSGGAEALALRLGVPIFAPVGASRRLPHDVIEYDDPTRIPFGDTPITAIPARD